MNTWQGPFTWLFNPMDVFERGLSGALAVLDGFVYRIVSLLFELFYALANAQLLNNEMYEAISTKIYVFIGVIALFTLSFSLLKTLVSPDEVGKTTIKSFKTLVTSIILLMLMPTIFQYAFSFQNAIMKDDVIGKIFQININQTDGKANNEKSMREMCNFENGETKNVDVNLEANYTVPDQIQVTKKQCEANYITMNVLEAFITPYNDSVVNTAGTSWQKAREYMIYTGNFNYVTTFVDKMLDSPPNESVSYTFILSTVAGCFLIYIILSFCIDLGVRAAKLAFYQLISPIPILMRLIPGKEGQFDKWTKAVISTFLEIFVRLIIINFVVFMCSNLFDIIDSSTSFGSVGIIGKAVLAIGLLMFAKQAPKLLNEAIGIEGGNLSFKIKDKLTGTPIVGKAFGSAYNTANKFKGAAQGAVTGSLGAGWTAFWNNSDMKKAMKVGGMSGFRNGGNQFNSQRQKAYSALGLKGNAGWFGGQEFTGKKEDDYLDDYKDNYKDNILKKWINDYEKGEKWQNNYNQKLSELRQQHSSVIQELENKAVENKNLRNQELSSLASSYANAKQKLQTMEQTAGDDLNKKAQIHAEMESLHDRFNNDRKLIDEKYTKLNAEIQKGIDIEKGILEGKTETRSILNEKGKVEQIEVNQLEQEAFKYARKQCSDEDVTYNDRLKVYTSRINEKEVNEYTRSLEGQKQEAVLAAALKKAGVSQKELEKIVSKNNK